MYNSNYEEYMQNVLGYNIRPQNTYQIPDDMYEMQRNSNYENASLESLYPEIYRIIQPMVQKVCMKCTGVINEEEVNKMTEEVYNAMSEDTRNQNDAKKTSTEVRSNNAQNNRKVEETRQNNYLLRDLIRILIIKELLRRPGRPPMRPGSIYPGVPNFPRM